MIYLYKKNYMHLENRAWSFFLMDICTSSFPNDCDGNNGATPDDRDEEMELTASTQRVSLCSSLSIFLFLVAKIACWSRLCK